MLTRHAARASRIFHKAYQQPQLGVSLSLLPRRNFVSLDVLKDGFLDLAIALPIPALWPAYSTTIILCTVLSRLALTVPFSIWAKRRQWRAEEQVLPILQSEQPTVAKRVLEDMQKDKVRGTKEELQKIHGTRMKEILTARRKELFAEYRCRPGVTMAIPPLTQLPIFVGCSMILSHLSRYPTPFDSEPFLTLSTLAHPDPTATLPIALGLITLANVESSAWFMTDQQRERQLKVQAWKEKKVARGETVLEPQKIIKSVLRLASIGRIIVATMVPGGVVLYWITSATFGLVQTWILDYWELRRKRKLAISSPLPSPSPMPTPPPPRSPSPPASAPRWKK
ncbi:60Kd inner membrane protein-domain-containing protein [Melanogaster broomeanus]|nr:60Kd inner membrane protein-domain-containing protein [Melanogaster broomeanus]